MTSKKPKTFEEKVNAILRYEEYTYSWDKARFLPKFAHLADDELESLLRLGQEIEQYAAEVAHSLFSFGELLTAKDEGRIEALSGAIREKYPYLDTIRADRLTASAAYNAVA